MKRAHAFFIIVSLFFYSAFSKILCAQDPAAIRYGSTINPIDISDYLHLLASDSLEGRETGKAGQKMAAAFIATHFARVGLRPPSHGTWFQQHPITTLANMGSNIEVNQRYFLFMKDYFFEPGFLDTLMVLDSLFFVGYGISDPVYDDYTNMTVEGKAVLFLEGSPDERKINFSGWSGDWSKKQAVINRKKPSVVFIVCDSMEKLIDSLNYKTPALAVKVLGSERYSTPVVFVTMEMAKSFFPENHEEQFEKAIKGINKKNKPRSLHISTSAFIRLVKNTDELMGENVAGFVEGTDKKEEHIIITAHYDHLGKNDSLVFHGADDDGSGTSAVMALAKAFALAKKEGHGPRRSVVFMTFSGEEKGLLGSSYYVHHPLFPLEKTVANMNADMIGRTDGKHDSLGIRDYVYIIGSDKISVSLHKINEVANATYSKLELDYQFNQLDNPKRYYYRSDHYNFAKQNIPVIFYFNGEHADYHRASDTVDKIDFDLLTRRTQLIFYTAWELANREGRIYPDKKEKQSGKNDEE